MTLADLYPAYVNKVDRKGRTRAELDQVVTWLTGVDDDQLAERLSDGTTVGAFFDAADLNPAADRITGSVCGVKVQEVEDPTMRRIRMLDKLVDELAKGRPMAKVLRD